MRMVFLFVGVVMLALNGCKMRDNSSLTNAQNQTSASEPKITTTVTREGKPVAGEKVFIDDQVMGTTSKNGQVEAIVEAGTHTVRAGDFSRQVDVQEDGQAWIEIQLPPLTTEGEGDQSAQGSATITATVTRQGKPVAGEKVFIDDQERGTTSQKGQVEVSVAAGTHTVRAGDFSRKVHVQEDGQAWLEIQIP